MIDFVSELRKADIGAAWHGNNLSEVISTVKHEQAFSYPVPGGHSIAELVLHISAWTMEVTSRMMGSLPGEPVIGDWRVPVAQSELVWNEIVAEFARANSDLLNLIATFPEDQWSAQLPLKPSSETAVNHFELLSGLVQHHAYHSGQIALLKKF